MMTLSGVLLNRHTTTAPPLFDMAIGLSRIRRFAGQTLTPWTVGQHLLASADYAKTLPFSGLELHVLLHDAHEAMTGDIPTSWKTDDMRELQKDLDQRVYASLGLSLPSPGMEVRIRNVDREMLMAEARWLTPAATYQRICDECGAVPAEVSRRVVFERWFAGESEAQVARQWSERVVTLLAAL